MKVTVTIDMAKAMDLMKKLSSGQVKQAAAKALTDAGFEARKSIQSQMDQNFDRVTPYIRRSIFVTPAKPDALLTVIEPRYQGGKGVDPKNVLLAEVFGGSRKQKASEKALQRVGILPSGYAIVPGSACPLDQYGNIKGSFLVQLISYFQAFGEQGYKANMTDRRKANLAKQGKTANGYQTINGVVYFVSMGKLRGGKTVHLSPGIWSKTGIHGSNVKPILMFVRNPSYRPRIDLLDKPVKAALDKFNPRFRYHMRNIIEAKS